MAPKVPPPSDPTSLLWAHQMKREHGLLLQKVEKLEVAISRIEALALAAQDRETDVAAVAQRVQTLTDESTHKNSAATEEAVKKIRQEVTDQFEDLDDRLEAIINKLDAVDKAGETATSNRKDAFDREVEMLKRVKGLEAGMKTYQDNIRMLGRKIDNVGVEQIQAQLSKLIQKVNDAGEDHERVKETLAMLENATEALTRENEHMDGQVSEMRDELRARAAEGATPARAPESGSVIMPAPAANVLANAPTPKTLAGVDAATALPAEKSPTAPTRKGRVKKSTVATVKPTGDMSMKRELAGLMSDVSAQDLKRRTVKPTTNTAPALSKNFGNTAAGLQKNIVTDEKTQKPIIRRGRGWVEVVKVITDDDEEDFAELAKLVPPSNAKQTPTHTSNTDFAGNPIPVKRGPGRPRKDTHALARPRKNLVSAGTPATDSDAAPVVKRGPGRPRKLVRQVSLQRSIEQPDAPVPKRRVIVQNDNTQARAIFGTIPKGKKRKADADAIDETMDLSAPRASRSQQEIRAPVAAKRQKPKAAAAHRPVQTYGRSKVKSRGGTPAAAKNVRKGLHDLPPSSTSPPPATSDPVQELLDTAAGELAQGPSGMPGVQKVSRKRTIPQIDDLQLSGKKGEDLAIAGFDKDFEM